MRRCLALLVLACAKPPQPPPIAHRPAPPLVVTDAGRLVLRSNQQLLVCIEDHTCTQTPADSVVQDGGTRYVIANQNGPAILDVATSALQPLTDSDVIARLDDGSLIRVEHLPRRSRIFHKTGVNWVALVAYEKFQALEFRFLPDGRHLFKDSPGMGGLESPHFIDLVIGHPTHLYAVDKIGGAPVRVHSSSQQMDADFIDRGRRIVWWQPGKVDATRTLHLQAIDLTTKQVRTLATTTGPLTTRSAPRTSSSPASTWVLYAEDETLQAIDVAGTAHASHPFENDERLLPGIPHHSRYNNQHSRRRSDHIVVRVGHELRVLAIPTFDVIYRLTVDTAQISAAEWVPS